MKNLVKYLPLFVLAISLVSNAETPDAIGYSSVKAAFNALKHDPNAKFHEDEGWTTVRQNNGNGWIFTPPWHPAYPAAFKRTVVEKDGELLVQSSTMCQGEKAACDRLTKEYERETNKIRQWYDRQPPWEKNAKEFSRDALQRSSILLHNEGIVIEDSALSLARPSFECAKATTKTEKTICGSQALTILDGEMAGWYRTLVRGDHPSAAVEQKRWIKSRNQCEITIHQENCLIDLYTRRVKELLTQHIAAYRPLGTYCINRCERYLFPAEVDDLRIRNDSVEFLLLTKSEFAKGRTAVHYSVQAYEDGRLIFKDSICSKEIKGNAEFGDPDCTPQKARSVFHSNAGTGVGRTVEWKEVIDESNWGKIVSAEMPLSILRAPADKMPAGTTITMNVPFSVPLTAEQQQREAPPYGARMFPIDCVAEKPLPPNVKERCVERFLYVNGAPKVNPTETGAGNSAYDQEGCFFDLYFEPESKSAKKVLSLRVEDGGWCFSTPSSGMKRVALFGLYEREKRVGNMLCARVEHVHSGPHGEPIGGCPTVSIGYVAVTVGQSEIRLKLPPK
jgi:uncharacterized protein